MKHAFKIFGLCTMTLNIPITANAELLTLLNYESKIGQPNRREGIAVIDVDPNSPNFNKIIKDTSLPRISWRTISITTEI
jgi:hypothetical protein